MKFALILIGVLVALGLAGLIGLIRFARWENGLLQTLEAAVPPVDVSARLPERVKEFARRADANPGDLARVVIFWQTAEMQLNPDQPWQPMEALQTVAIGEAGFVWKAQQAFGPFPKFQVVDAFVGGEGWLRVRLFGLFPVVNATGLEMRRDEGLRYLAELPWAPDAILGNPALQWREIDRDWVEVSIPEVAAAVRFRFDEAGDIAEVRAGARGATDDAGNRVEYPWQGYFRDYRMIGPRRIPAEAEVGYLRPDGYRAYFQGRITGYDAVH